MSDTIRGRARADERTLGRMRALAPAHPERFGSRVRGSIGDWLERRVGWWLAKPVYGQSGHRCAYCGRKRGVSGRLVVNPISLQRQRMLICRNPSCNDALKNWIGTGEARRRRSQWDWEQEHPTVAAKALIGYIPPQYPSVSRATLRAFLDSDLESATVGDSDERDAGSLNGSIRSLGFSSEVFAEIRSGQAVLRRVTR